MILILCFIYMIHMSENSNRNNDGNKNLTKGTTDHGAVTQGVVQTAEDVNSGEARNADDVSKVVSSGTSLTKPEGIDKTDIYSTSDDGTRDIEKAQEKPVTKVEDKEKGAWKIKED